MTGEEERDVRRNGPDGASTQEKAREGLPMGTAWLYEGD